MLCNASNSETKRLAREHAFRLPRVAKYQEGQAKMSRERKLTKYVLSVALQANNSVAGAARYLGVDRRTVQRSIKYFGLDKVAPKARIDADLGRFASLSAPASSIDTANLEVQSRANPTPQTKKAERNPPRLTAGDFSGRCVQDRADSGARVTVEGLIARYHRLRGS
jgi:hypothetical protein